MMPTPLAQFLIKATIILIVALGITRALRHVSAGVRHLVWLVTLAVLLLVPALSAWSPLRLAVLPPERVANAGAGSFANDAAAVRSLVATAPVPAPQAVVSTPPEVAPPRDAFATHPLAFVLMLWAAGALVVAISLAWAWATVGRIVRRGHALTDRAWTDPLYEMSDRLGIEEPPRLVCSDDARMPFACGVMRATIVLPAECETWTPERRRAVLLHELAHVRRHDLVGHTLARVTCAVYWFHPLVWVGARHLRSESERACDDIALACGAHAPDYAEHLLDIVTSVRRDRTPIVALAMARPSEFEGRMLAILDPERPRALPGRRQTILTTMVLGLCAVLVAAARPMPRAAAASVLPVQAATKDSTPANTKDRTHTRTPAYPDSGVPGHMEMHTTFSQQTVTSQSMHELTSGSEDGKKSEAEYDKAGSGLKMLQGAVTADERITLLVKVLRTDTSAALRRTAAWGLAQYADKQEAADALAAALRGDADPEVREMAAWALGDGDARTSAASEALVAALRSDKDVHVRETAAWAMGDADMRGGVDALASALTDPEPGVRERAAWAIGNIEPKEAPPALLALLKDKDPNMRRLATWSLMNIEDVAAVPALQAALKVETNKELQIDYIRALSRMGETSVDAVRPLLESSDPRIKEMAVRALAGGQGSDPWPWPWPEPRPSP